MIETLLTILCFIIPILYVKFQDGSLSIDDFNKESYPKRKYKPRKHYLDDIDIPDTHQNKDLSKEFYVSHLMSEKWKQTKLTRLLIDDFKCKQCNKPITAETSNCHHITYQNLGDEGMKDVVSVCPKCHNDIHEFYGKNAGHYPLIKR